MKKLTDESVLTSEEVNFLEFHKEERNFERKSSAFIGEIKSSSSKNRTYLVHHLANKAVSAQ